MGKTSRKYKKRDDVAATVAQLHGVTTRYVQMVRNGEREDDGITETLIEYTQGKSKLIQTLRNMIPLTPNPKKYGRQKK